jgi:signal transduction histidine kinase
MALRQAEPNMPESKPIKILIVDDDLGLLRLVARTLKREGFETATSGSGQEAIAWLTKNHADLMLLDLKLQDIEGKELINHLTGIGRSVPFLIITGQGDERVAVEMMKRGALDYLVKDVQFIEFVPTVVRRALEQLEKDKQLVAAQAALKESQVQLLAISEREQTRFGAELHDGLGQQLTAIELRCQSMKEDLPASRADLRKQISEICQFLREAIAQTRSLARGLSPVNLGSGGLVEALGELAGRMSREGGIQCAFDCSSPVLWGDNHAAGHLFRIAQEAVNNAVKHSGATEIGVRLTNNGGVLHLEISDNGQGLPKARQLNQGIGLQIMKHRASIIGADLEIKSQAGTGVTVTCKLKS